MNHFYGTGNLGSDPESKPVTVDGEERTVVEFRVYFDRQVPDGDRGWTDKGGFWRTVQIWKEGLGQRVQDHLVKGARVFVMGQVKASQWTDDHDQNRTSYDIVADYVAPDLIGIDAIEYQERKAA